jgi:hypothetical protein
VTDFIIEHQCPQCGAPAEFSETDRLLACEFCRVRSYLTRRGGFRYVIPHHAPPGKEIRYYPYWRFKGMLFTCIAKRIVNRFIDTSYQALESPDFPFNIGFRGQSQKLRFAAAESNGVFIKPGIPFKKILDRVRENFSPEPSGAISHQEFIGESKSLIYSPFYFDPKLMDAVINQPVWHASSGNIPEDLLQVDNDLGHIHFLAALCPQCGWDLSGDSDSLVLTCENCRTAWWENSGSFAKVETAHFHENGDDPVYLPFWRIQAGVTPVRLETYADLIKIANLPKVPGPGWDKIPFYFWNPAFKVRPQSYLAIAANVTLNQPTEKAVPGHPAGTVHSVTLSLKEAVESIKINIAHFIRPIEARVNLVPQIEIQPRRYQLVYIPFKNTRIELIQPRLNLAVNKNVLFHARNL